MRTLILCCLVAFTLCACGSTSKRRVAEAPPPTYQPTPESTPISFAINAAPKEAEVKQAIKRVFKDAAVLDTNYNPSFFAGDFNGDGSQDIAVIIKPVKLDEMNQDLPPWLVRQPRSNRDTRVRIPIEKNDTLLAVIHGYGANHWRDPDATQTFVLKDVVGSGLKVESPKDFITANSGRKLPRAQGDVIGETVGGSLGYLYFAQATYSWYDPKTFTGEAAAPGAFHKPHAMR